MAGNGAKGGNGVNCTNVPPVSKWFPAADIMEQLDIMRRYAPYIRQEEKAADRARRDEAIEIPGWLDWDKCASIRYESREKLKKPVPTM